MGDPPEIELSLGTLVIGDLHLDVEEPLEVERFNAWLASAAGLPRLIVLGDLFEYWIGGAQAATAGGRQVLAALAERTAAGTAIDVIPGNRDFLLGRAFEQATGCEVRPNGLLGRAPNGERVLFLHGDELSTLDTSYQRLRRVLRSPPLLWLATRMPSWLAERVARRLRRVSRSAVAAKPSARTAQQPSACRAWAQRFDAAVLVCGHAHRYRDERILEGPRWIVVDAFGGAQDTLELLESGELAPRSRGGSS